LVFVDQIPGTHRLRTVSFVGESFPLCDTANGKACLAKLTDSQVLSRLGEEQPGIVADPARLKAYQKEIETIRPSDADFDRDKHTVGISAVGGAFRDLQGDLYAISIPTPSSRFDAHEGQLTEELNRTLSQIVALEIFRAD